MTITQSNVPQLSGNTWADAKAWFASLRPHRTGVYVPGWHMDDGFSGADGVTPEAAKIIAATAKQILVSSHRWPDRSAAYDLCADVKVAAERIWPGFLADVHTAASRIGCVSIPGRELPNFVIEEHGGEFFLLEFTAVGPISECPLFRMSRIEGARFDQSAVNSSDYVDLSKARVLEETTREFDELDHDYLVIEDLRHEASALTRRPNPRQL